MHLFLRSRLQDDAEESTAEYLAEYLSQQQVPARRSFAFIINPPMMPDKTLPHAEVNAENAIFQQ